MSCSAGEAGEAGDQPVRREDQEAGVAHADEHHEAEVGRVVVAGIIAVLDPLIAILEAGLIAMVTVGDEDRLARHQAADGGVRFEVVDDPEPVLDPEVVGCHHRRAVAESLLDGSQHRALGVGIEAEDRAEIEAGRVVEGQAVRLGAGERLLVRVDLPLAERLQPDPSQEAPSAVLHAVDLERLIVNVERGVVLLAEDAVAQPFLEEPGGGA